MITKFHWKVITIRFSHQDQMYVATVRRRHESRVIYLPYAVSVGFRILLKEFV